MYYDDISVYNRFDTTGLMDYKVKQVVQLMLTTGSTCLAVNQGQQT